MNHSPTKGFRLRSLSLALVSAFLLAGCMGGYNTKVSDTVAAARSGSPQAALADLEANNPGKDKDLLYFLEKGELQRMQGSLNDSITSWMEADSRVREWEEAVKTDFSKVLGDVGAFVINDTMRRYDGRDYEKVLLSTRLALNHVAEGNWDAARVEIKKMHEREAIIAEFRSKELDDAKQKTEEKGLKATSFKDLQGYPVETLDDPEVQALKNSYESAFANYLAGFVYEALGEPSLAAAGYRKAIEMRPGQPILEEALAKLDQRTAPAPKIKRTSNDKSKKHGEGVAGVDTLIVVETGNAPAIKSRVLPIPLPIPSKGGLQVVMTPLSWPVVDKGDVNSVPANLTLNSNLQPLVLVTSVDQMARRAIADEMPGIIARSSVRAIVKGAAQKAIQDNASGVAGAVLSIVAGVAAVASEQADERSWQTLPGFFSLTRAVLPHGTNQITLNTPLGPVSREVSLSGKHALVVLRTSGNALYLSQTPFDPNALPVAVVEAEPEPPKSKSKAVPKRKTEKSSKPATKNASL